MKKNSITNLIALCMFIVLHPTNAQTPLSSAINNVDYSEKISTFYTHYANCDFSRESLDSLLSNYCTDQMRKGHLDVIFADGYDFLTNEIGIDKDKTSTIQVEKKEDYYILSFEYVTWPKFKIAKNYAHLYLDETGKIAYVVRPSDGYIFPDPAEVVYNGIIYSVVDSCSVGIKCCKESISQSVNIISKIININDVGYSVVSMSDSAFANCTNLTSVTIPGTVQKPGMYVFRGCKNLASATLQEGIPYIDTGMFVDCEKLTSVSIPESVTHIWSVAFSGCKSLASLTLPSGLKKLEGTIFRGCTSLKTITCLATTVPELRADGTTFNNFDRSQCTLVVPKGCAAKYRAAEGWKEFGTIVEM